MIKKWDKFFESSLIDDIEDTLHRLQEIIISYSEDELKYELEVCIEYNNDTDSQKKYMWFNSNLKLKGSSGGFSDFQRAVWGDRGDFETVSTVDFGDKIQSVLINLKRNKYPYKIMIGICTNFDQNKSKNLKSIIKLLDQRIQSEFDFVPVDVELMDRRVTPTYFFGNNTLIYHYS